MKTLSHEFSCRDAATFNCVYVRKSDTRVGRDVGQRPPTLTEVISAPRQCEAHPRDASFFKRPLVLSFSSHATTSVLAPFVKTIPRRLRVSHLRKNMRQEDPRFLYPPSLGPSFVFCLPPSGTMFYGCTSGPLTTPSFPWIFIRLFMWSELPEAR